MVGFKGRFKDDPCFDTERALEVTSMWSDYLLGRPENHMTGVSFARGGYHRIGKRVTNGSGGYTIHRPDHWLFDGTGIGYGDVLGAGATVVGYECDGCEFTYRDGLPYPTGEDGTPSTFEILGTAPAAHFTRDTATRPAEARRTVGDRVHRVAVVRQPRARSGREDRRRSRRPRHLHVRRAAEPSSPPAAPTGPTGSPAATRRSSRSPATSSTASRADHAVSVLAPPTGLLPARQVRGPRDEAFPRELAPGGFAGFSGPTATRGGAPRPQARAPSGGWNTDRSAFGEARHRLRWVAAIHRGRGPTRSTPWMGGTIAIRFPIEGDPGDDGWHVDGSYLGPDGSWWLNHRSDDRALLMLVLFSDVGVDDAPTRIRVGSHHDIPEVLAPFGDAGVSH